MAETQVATKSPTTSSSTTAKPTGADSAARTPNRRMQAVGNSLTVLGVMLLTFVLSVTVIGSLQFSRDQKTMYDDFRGALANATAPVSQLTATGGLIPLGTPVALLTFPTLHKQQFVVVEGTTSDVLMGAPGHRRDTVLPGQAGLSVIFGRRAMFGGPFNALTELKVNDKITATTGQGTSTYIVRQIRKAGDKQQPTAAAGRLTLMTAAGQPYRPDGVLYIDADLQSQAQPSDTRYVNYTSLLPGERAMQGQASNWVAVLLLGQALLLATVGIVWLYMRQGRLVAWVIGLPVLLAIGVALSDQIAGLLPNLM